VTLTLDSANPRAVALKAAITHGDVAALQTMLRDAPELATAWVVDHRGGARSPLHIAADWPGHFPNGAAIVAVLIAAGADVNARMTHRRPGESSESPLHWAASSDDVAVLDALLDGGADIETPGAVHTGGTAMSDAVVFAQWKAARRLLERGASTTVWQAAALGLLDRVAELCDAEKPSKRDLTNALWHACSGGQQAVAAFLLDRGADLYWIGYDHKTPLDVARESGNAALVEWLKLRTMAH
jgi:ankyrin repeat protein